MTFAGEFLGLPGLRGYWPMSAFDSSGNAIDQSGNARTLTYNGNPTYNFHASGGPYIDLDGTGDYLSRADEAGLDILGSEAYVASAVRGLTVGGWFWADTTTASAGYFAKYDGSVAGSSFVLVQADTDTITFVIYSSSTQYLITAPNSQMTTGAWHFVAGKFVPSTEQSLYIDANAKTTDTTGIPATLNNSTVALEIGRLPVANIVFNGRAGMCFLCTMALDDTAIDNIYQNTKAYYGL